MAPFLSTHFRLAIALSCSYALTSFVSPSVASTVTHQPIIFRRAVVVGDTNIGELEIHQDEEPADAIYVFGTTHNLDENTRSAILDDICVAVTCRRRQALLWSTPVSAGDQFVGYFELFEGVEPVDAAHAFVTHHSLSLGYRNAILSDACDVVECARVVPVIWRKKLNIDGSVVEIAVQEGEEPADVIFSGTLGYGLSVDGRRRILEEAKKDNLAISRDFALVYSQKISLDDGSIAGTLRIWDDGKEPIDSVYEFVSKNTIEAHFDQLCDSILPHICALLPCQRLSPLVWRQDLVNDEDGHPLGTLEILMNEEPIDAIDRLVQSRGLDIAYRENLLRLVCEQIECERTLPVVFKKDVLDEAGSPIGTVEVLEGEEVIDAVVRFIRDSGADMDQIALKNWFFQQACGVPRVKCTRNVAVVFHRLMKREDGSVIADLVVKENEEPADVAFAWCKEHQLGEDYVFSVIEVVCKTPGVICNRDAPLILSVPLTGPEGGDHVGRLEVKLRQEPADAVYAFFATYGLFEKKWDMQEVVTQICNFPDITCNRRKALKYYDEKFTMGGKDVGSLVVWEDEEVVDKLYEIRTKFNLTLEDQMLSFTHICALPRVICERTKAVVYKMSDITKLDYEKFGNETCSRQYAGFQHLSSFSSFPFQSEFRKILEKETVKAALAHALLGPSMLLLVFTFVSSIFLFAERHKKKLLAGQKMVVYAYALIAISVLQVCLIEPTDAIDKAMHMFEGKLPDLLVFEEDEPVDAVLKWGKEAARKHHPIVREKIHDEILNKVCHDVEHSNCTRRRAWEAIDMGAITLYGQQHKIEYLNPGVDPVARSMCGPAMDGTTDLCLLSSAEAHCRRLQPQPANCASDISRHMNEQLEEYEGRRLDNKDTYKKLGLEMDAPSHELFSRVGSIVRSRGMNISPFGRVDNGTAVYPKWDKHTMEAWAAIDAFNKVKDPESREWNDKPCEPVLGGALCAKTDKDGNMMIEV